MNDRGTSDAGQERALLALFEEIEPPPGLQDRWRTRLALRPAEENRPVPPPPAVRELRADPTRPPTVAPWARVAAVGVGVLTAGVIVVGVVAANRVPPTVPEPDATLTITNPPSTTSTPLALPPPTSANGPNEASAAAGTQPKGGSEPRTGRPPTANPGGPTVAPARGPLSEWPDEANAGVTPGTVLRAHPGDLHVTTPGAIVYDLRVDGVIYVEAPDVTLRRVFVAPPRGADSGVRQSSQAPRLKIEDSEISGNQPQYAVRQEAAGLTVQRSIVPSIAVASDATIVDSYVGNVSTNGNTTRLVVRHNTINTITLSDSSGPVTDVRIENNQLGDGTGVVIRGPSGPGSHHIRVTDNHFRFSGGHPAPSSGWNGQAPGNLWTGNVWFGTSEPVNP